MYRKTAAMTALVPPEVIYTSGWKAQDINNGIPASLAHPRSKLCAWTASWREAILKGRIRPDALIVVAGGDCHNALADGQVAARKVPATHFFFYPFDGDAGYLKEQIAALEGFLCGERSEEGRAGHSKMPRTSVRGRSRYRALEPCRSRQGEERGPNGEESRPDERVLSCISEAKKLGMELDRARSEGKLDPEKTFEALISFSDLEGDPAAFRKRVGMLLSEKEKVSAPQLPRVALIGVPPIYRDFHRVCAEAGLHVVFDELPYEFLRLGGRNIDELARNYSTYTFARPVEFRLKFLKRELAKRRIDGIVHYTQFTCHHMLEDGLFRQELDWPMLTVQGDLPGETPAQVRLRLEAFGELLGGK
jgi:hypothetical protein